MKFFRNQNTADSILAAFSTAITALRKVVDDQSAEAVRQAAVAAAASETAKVAAENARVAAAEAARAGTLASRFEALVAEELGE